MQEKKTLDYLKYVLGNVPADWLNLTTHRLDIYDEQLAKVQFLEKFETLVEKNFRSTSALLELPTAFDYIRLGHPLSCVLEWAIAVTNNHSADHVISFSSMTTPVLAVLRKNLLIQQKTQIHYIGKLPACLDTDALRNVYGYNFSLNKIESVDDVQSFTGSNVLILDKQKIHSFDLNDNVDFIINIQAQLGSILFVNGKKNAEYISEIQHVRRRETIAMTPANTLIALESFVANTPVKFKPSKVAENKAIVLQNLKEITGTNSNALVGSSGLSIQYAIMMGLINHSIDHHPGKDIKFIVPTNCYGGTNDQARRVAACIDLVEVVDLAVDGEHDMVSSLEKVLKDLAREDAVPYIIAEIPTNPRVEVPNLQNLLAVLSAERTTAAGTTAIDPVFILDQTFCPNIHFLGEGEILSTVRAISYSSGSKFPSGGKVTAGYCVANNKCDDLMENIERHLSLCDNEATDLQYEVLAHQLPSMLQRIKDAYVNTRSFVNYIQELLPASKINFVSEALAKDGFTPSVFSLDLPTKGNTAAEKETYKRALNLKLINLMISEIPDQSKYCVSYGQLKGCYWTIPATSTQGTTKEGDKDYIVRASLSPDLDLKLHKQVFAKFVSEIE